MAVTSGTVTLNSSTPTKICTMGESGALVAASAARFIGGPNVAASGANAGVPLSTTPVQVPGARPRGIAVVPGVADDTADLYGIAGTGTPTVSFLAAQGG